MSFDYPIPFLPLLDFGFGAYVNGLVGVLYQLERVCLQGSCYVVASILPYLKDVRTLAFDHVAGLFPPPVGKVHDDAFLRLERLQFTHSDTPSIFKYFLDDSPLPNLIAISIDCDSVIHDPSPRPLPASALAHVRSLQLRGDLSLVTNPHPLLPLSSLPLAHVDLYDWPTSDFLSALPSSIELLDVDASDIPEKDADEEFAAFRNWKARWFPALRAVRLQVRGAGHQRGMFAQRQRVLAGVKALVKEVEGF